MTNNKRYMILVALTVALGGFVWGFDATVISGAVPFIQKYFELTGDRGDFLLGLAVSCLGWGVLGGTAVAGYLQRPVRPQEGADRHGGVLHRLRAAVGVDDQFLACSSSPGFWAGSRWAAPS